MPLDTSIYGNIQQPKIEGPLDQYSRLAQLRNLQTTGRLHELQGTQAEQALEEQQAVREAGMASGGDTSKLPGLLLGRGAVKPGMEAQAALIKAEQERAATQHTQAQTKQIAGGAFSSSIAGILKDPSDTGVKNAFAAYQQQTGNDVTQPMAQYLALPEAARKQLAIQQAMAHPNGVSVLKELYPEAKTQTMGTAPDYTMTTTTTRPGLTIQQPGAGKPQTPQPIDLAKTTPAELEAGYRYFSDGTLPPNMGRGNQGSAQATRIRDIAAEISKNLGVSPEDVRANQLAFKGSGSALMGLMKREAGVGANVRNFDFNSDQALQLSDKVDRTGTPVVNAWINAGRRKVSGNPEISAFDVAIKTTVNEFAQIVSGTTAGATTEGEKKKAEDLLNAQQTPAQIKSVINQMRVESQNRMKSFADQKSEVLRNMRGGRGANALPVSGAAAPALSPEAQKLIDKYAPVGGVRG